MRRLKNIEEEAEINKKKRSIIELTLVSKFK